MTSHELHPTPSHRYDWRKHERALNEELPQFTCNINVEGFGSLNIHFVHKKSCEENGIPLLFVHGCKFSSPADIHIAI
jgi:hypothetical protein